MNETDRASRTLLIFDLDGTLYRTETSFLETMRRVYRVHGVPPPPDREIMAMVGETFADFLAWLKPQGFKPSVEDLAERIAEIELAAIREQGQAYPGVLDTLRNLKSSGYRLAICTNGDARYAEAVLRAIGAWELFDAIKTFEDESHPKPAMVAQLQAAFRPSRTVMVGDRRHDVEAGRANDCLVVGAGYGFARPGELNAADYIITSLTELPDLLVRLL
jgi:phosphoglycolate phosphatase